jgi:tetratricopeptide (TPR) repeat protein
MKIAFREDSNIFLLDRPDCPMKPTDKLKEGQAAFFANPPDFQKARDCFARVVLCAPEWVEGHHWFALACENGADHNQAVKSFRRAIQCDPKDPRPRIALGRLLQRMGHLKEAIAELKKGIALKPHYAEADARLFLAEAYEKAHDIAKARNQWKVVAEMESSYPSYDEPMREARKKLDE